MDSFPLLGQNEFAITPDEDIYIFDQSMPKEEKDHIRTEFKKWWAKHRIDIMTKDYLE